MPYYTHPECKSLFTAKRRPKKKARPIEGQDVTMQASQPGQNEATVANTDAGGLAATGNKSDNAGAADKAMSTNETTRTTLNTSPLQPGSGAVDDIHQASSSDAAPPQSSRDGSPKTHSTAQTADDTTGDSQHKSNNDEPGESLVNELAPQTVKSEAVPLRPKKWADLLKKDPAAKKAASDGQVRSNGVDSTQASSALGTCQPSTKALADVLRGYNPLNSKAFFIEPRGLYNARVDCYMISVSHGSES